MNKQKLLRWLQENQDLLAEDDHPLNTNVLSAPITQKPDKRAQVIYGGNYFTLIDDENSGEWIWNALIYFTPRPLPRGLPGASSGWGATPYRACLDALVLAGE